MRTAATLVPATPAATVPPKLRAAAQAFEAQALAALLTPMFATVKTGDFGGGAAEGQWQPMLVDAMAKAATRAGNGLGLADQVMRELLRRQSAGDHAEDRMS